MSIARQAYDARLRGPNHRYPLKRRAANSKTLVLDLRSGNTLRFVGPKQSAVLGEPQNASNRRADSSGRNELDESLWGALECFRCGGVVAKEGGPADCPEARRSERQTHETPTSLAQHAHWGCGGCRCGSGNRRSVMSWHWGQLFFGERHFSRDRRSARLRPRRSRRSSSAKPQNDLSRGGPLILAVPQIRSLH